VRFAPATPGGAPDLVRSVAACLATILDLPSAAVPAPDGPEPWTVWRSWLGSRGLGLVPISEPAAFSWPGPWIAVLDAGDGPAGVVAFGAPPGIVHDPLDRGVPFAAVRAGHIVAPADVALWRPAAPTVIGQAGGHVEAVLVAATAGAPMVAVRAARAVAGRGLEGDRYFDGAGTFSNPHATGHDLTLVAAEQLEAALGAPAERHAAARRNVVTRGIDLDALVGRRFAVGDAECIGRRLCEPCARLERLTEPGTLRALVHRGGLRADVVSDGTIRPGAAVTPLA
jgi:hypothetical protein